MASVTTSQTARELAELDRTLAVKLAELAPSGLTHSFFTSGGLESNESAISEAETHRLADATRDVLSRLSRLSPDGTFAAR